MDPVVAFTSALLALQPVMPPAQVHEPAGQVVGFYSHGNLSSATALPLEGPGYVHLFQPRQRHFGSEGLVGLIESVAGELAARFTDGERLQIGDIAQEKGGEISGHASHQNGLDMDIKYFRVDHREQDPSRTDGFDEVFVRDGVVSANFDVARNWELTQAWVASGRVNRIFMDPAIKHAFCAVARGKGELETRAEILRRIQPYPNHDDHMHVRLTCPSTSARCQSQADLPPGSGC